MFLETSEKNCFIKAVLVLMFPVAKAYANSTSYPLKPTLVSTIVIISVIHSYLT